MNNLAERIAKLRKDKGWTQKELAEKLHVSDSSISRWEKEESYPDITLLIPLADVFELSVDDLLRGKKRYRDIHKKDVEEWLPFILSLIAIITFYLLQKLGMNIVITAILYILLIRAGKELLLRHTDGTKMLTYHKFNCLFHFFVIFELTSQCFLLLSLSSMMGYSVIDMLGTNMQLTDFSSFSDPIRDAYLLAITASAIAACAIYLIGKPPKAEHADHEKEAQGDLDSQAMQ